VFLDLKQRNPMAIISGFGGTLNLVLSLVVMALAVFPFGWLYHLKAMGQIGPSAFAGRQALVFAWLAFLTLTSTLLPLHLGRRSLMAREY